MALKRTDSHSAVDGDRRPRRVGVRVGRDEACPVGGSVAAYGADLGGSSKYSSENLEGRSGERFLENSSWSRVNRS
jgi:hypothetical protein